MGAAAQFPTQVVDQFADIGSALTADRELRPPPLPARNLEGVHLTQTCGPFHAAPTRWDLLDHAAELAEGAFKLPVRNVAVERHHPCVGLVAAQQQAGDTGASAQQDGQYAGHHRVERAAMADLIRP